MSTHREHRRGRPRPLDLLQPGMAPHDPTGELLVVTEATGEERGMLSVAELLARRDRINAHLIGVDRSSTDGAALTPGLTEFLHKRFSIPTEIANPLSRIQYDPSLFAGQDVMKVAPLLTVGIGLALRRLGDKK